MNTHGKNQRTNLREVLLYLLPLLFLYFLVFFSFNIHQLLTCNYQLLYPIAFLATYFIFLFITPTILQRTSFSSSAKPFLIFGFILANTVSLYKLSSINRESEIRNYITKNEHQLNSVLIKHQNNPDHKGISEIANGLNICAFFPHQNNYYFKLYTFLGYGYGIIYTDSNTLTKPVTSPGGSPIIKWIKLDEHWYYFSYFD